MTRIRVSIEVLEGLEEIRESGLTNMFDRNTVIDLAYQFGYEEAAEWIGNNPNKYGRGIFVGFEGYDEEDKCQREE